MSGEHEDWKEMRDIRASLNLTLAAFGAALGTAERPYVREVVWRWECPPDRKSAKRVQPVVLARARDLLERARTAEGA